MKLRFFAIALVLAALVGAIIFAIVHATDKDSNNGSKVYTADRVSSLPGLGTPSTLTLSGYVLANASNQAYIYYYFSESQSNPATDPVILWLSGGPGTSSTFGNFVENGPYSINPQGQFSQNPYSWNRQASVLYIDQPVGTGWSYTTNPDGYVTDMYQMAADLFTALVNFFKLHPEYSKQPFYIFAESYGGKYGPFLSAYMFNQSAVPSIINLQGLALGNGWVDAIQTSSYAPLLTRWGRITESQAAVANASLPSFYEMIAQGQWLDAMNFDNYLIGNLSLQAVPPVLDQFDIRQASDPTDPPYNAMVSWFNQDAVKSALHTSGKIFSDGVTVYNKLDYDEEQSALIQLIWVLNQKNPPRVLLYNGVYDLVCSYIGTRMMVEKLTWPGKPTFAIAPNTTWTVDGSYAGYYQTGGGLTVLVVDNAGHMSPFDQPKNLYEMVERFLHGLL